MTEKYFNKHNELKKKIITESCPVLNENEKSF